MAEPPFTLGMDVCGVVDAAGAGRRAVDRPAGRRDDQPVVRRHGRRRARRATACSTHPPELDDVEAAAFTLPFHVGYLAPPRRAALAAGEALLVVGGASAVGTAAIQLGVAAGAQRHRHRRRARRRVALCRSSGAELVDRPHRRGRLRRGDGRTPTAAAPTSSFDLVGGDGTETIWTCVATGGRYLPVGFNDDPSRASPAGRCARCRWATSR